jgi:hypothetical protein
MRFFSLFLFYFLAFFFLSPLGCLCVFHSLLLLLLLSRFSLLGPDGCVFSTPPRVSRRVCLCVCVCDALLLERHLHPQSRGGCVSVSRHLLKKEEKRQSSRVHLCCLLSPQTSNGYVDRYQQNFVKTVRKQPTSLVCRFLWAFWGFFSSSPKVVWWDDDVVVVSESAAGNGHRERERDYTSD